MPGRTTFSTRNPEAVGAASPARALLVRLSSMLDHSLGGTRCRTIRPIAHHAGNLPRALAGTVRYATENLGRTLIRVDFDSGQSLMVLPDDVRLDAACALGAAE